ncbi:MAG: alanyl-tRNA editing protein [Candidatus Micrarchaeota archaeon]
MTELLYLRDSYLREFDATVVAVEGNAVELDRTAFYPEGGGQASDEGTLSVNGTAHKVLRGLKKEGRVWHELDSTQGVSVGVRVHGVLDWGRRYALMRHHSAAHLLSSIICLRTGAQVTGNQKYPDRARVDFNLPGFDRQKVAEWEKEANEWVEKGIPIEIKSVSPEELEKDERLCKLKKGLPPGLASVRVIDTGFDAIACAGTHVKNTREIGKIKVTKIESKGREQKRIEFVLEPI